MSGGSPSPACDEGPRPVAASDEANGAFRSSHLASDLARRTRLGSGRGTCSAHCVAEYDCAQLGASACKLGASQASAAE
jgi:hypothetical protein